MLRVIDSHSDLFASGIKTSARCELVVSIRDGAKKTFGPQTSLGRVTDGLNVVAVGITNKDPVIVRVVLRP